MGNPNLSSTLQFGYAPLSAYEFDKLLNDKDIIAALEHSVLYIIARRALIQFINYKVNNSNYIMSFDLIRKDVKTPLHCDFYLSDYPDFKDKDLKILNGSYTSDNTKTHGIKFYDAKTNDFLLWFNAEKFLWLVSHDILKADIIGDMFDFLSFEVLYVGKCTDENIVKRFNGHHALQKILINEKIITEDYQNSHELVILPFEYKDNTFITMYDYTNIENILSDQNNIKNISNRTIALDEEKALIKCLNPKYNTIKYKSYPVSSDGLYSKNLGRKTYSFSENIRLKYENGYIIGNVNCFDPSVSFIGVDGENVEVLNFQTIN